MPQANATGTSHPEEGLSSSFSDMARTPLGSHSLPDSPAVPEEATFQSLNEGSNRAHHPQTPSEQQEGTGSGLPTPSSSNKQSPNASTDRFHPLATATLQTTVFDVVHLFSDLGISAVPIVDNETGQVINLYEAVDVVDLVRSNAYHVLDLTLEDALSRRSKDFPGVVTCTPDDSLASILAYVREKRAHRFIIVEGEDNPAEMEGAPIDIEKPKKVPGRLLGVLCLSDILK